MKIPEMEREIQERKLAAMDRYLETWAQAAILEGVEFKAETVEEWLRGRKLVDEKLADVVSEMLFVTMFRIVKPERYEELVPKYQEYLGGMRRLLAGVLNWGAE